MPGIRDATLADLPRVLEITDQAIANTTVVWTPVPTTLEARRISMDDRRGRGFPVLVADLDGVVGGFASHGAYRPWDGYLHTVEHSVYVHPDAQGRDLGRALLAALIERASVQGKHVMVAGIEVATWRRSRCTGRRVFTRSRCCGRSAGG